MKIACVTSYDATTADGYGVRAYYMFQALRHQCESIDYIGSLKIPKLYSWLFKAKGHFYRRFVKKHYGYDRDRLLLKAYARQIDCKLSTSNVDVLLSPVSPASQPIVYVKSDVPIVIWTDATFAAAIDFYPELSESLTCRETIRDGIANERKALSKCRLAI